MIDWLVQKIFWWAPLRRAIFAEVHMYDEVEERLKDTTPGSLLWPDVDGWRSWTFSSERNKYYFNDIPAEFQEAFRYTYESVGPEFDMDEVW